MFFGLASCSVVMVDAIIVSENLGRNESWVKRCSRTKSLIKSNLGYIMEKEDKDLEGFSPKGAVAFFLIMITVYVVMWFSLYFELIGRG
ncbi:MAG: hypothetical protein EBR93_05580 [Bacteroidetes bacterium]|nr:hypothetical protein [Bacteroidota bacterium]